MIELHDLNICLVEPSPVQAKTITAYLGEIGVTQIEKLNNGAEINEVLERAILPDMIMSALYLPDMTGTDLLHAIRKHPSQSSLPFVLISSETDPRNLEDIRQAGPTGILPKPFTQIQLLRALQNTLNFLNAEEERDETTDLNLSEQHVLLVDDSKIARRHIRGVLERIGLEKFTEVTDGREAMKCIDEALYDLVVTDYNMPNVDGLGLTDYIRTKSVQPSVPILMVSSEHDEGRLAAVMDAGVSAVCDKPFETGLVRKMVYQFLRSRNEG